MSRISRDEEARLAAEMERDAGNAEQWEEVPAPPQPVRRRLGTQVTIRLDGAAAEQLREIARERGTGYTSLLRAWIEERLRQEISLVRAPRFQLLPAGESVEKGAAHLSRKGLDQIQLVGASPA